jgi:hypothetical protein
MTVSARYFATLFARTQIFQKVDKLKSAINSPKKQFWLFFPSMDINHINESYLLIEVNCP